MAQKVGWFRYKLARKLDEGEVERVKALAGPIYLPWSDEIVAPTNGAWLAERELNALAVPGRCTAVSPVPTTLPALPHIDGLREWVPDFLTAYQRDFLLFGIPRDGVMAVHPTGAGKTLEGIIYGLAHGGLTVFITRAAARMTIAEDVVRYTMVRPLVLTSQPPAKKRRNPDVDYGTEVVPGTRIVIVAWESLKSYTKTILAAQPTTAIFDESHIASNHKRREAIVQRTEDGESVRREDGKEAIKFRKLDNRFAAAEDVSRAVSWRLALTATPVRDRLKNLWAQVDLIVPRGFGTFRDWATRYCTPAETPIWMGDFTFKPISEVRVGDEIVGWDHHVPGVVPHGRTKGRERKSLKSKLTRATVLNVMQREAPVFKLRMASGRIIRCTADHRWLSGIGPTNAPHAFVQPKVGRALAFVADPTLPKLTPAQEHTAGWLAGMYDGEGSGPFIAQSSQHNPETFAALDRALTDLGIEHSMAEDSLTRGAGGATILGGREGLLRFQKIVRSVRFPKSAEKRVLVGKFRTPDRIVSIEPDGVETVYALTTTTGNYVAWGYASRNCDGHDNPWGGRDYDGRSNVEELLARMSFFTHYIPHSVTHHDLPAKRRQVTYIAAEDLATGKDVLKELRSHAGDTAWAKLAQAAAMKRPMLVAAAVEAAYTSSDGQGGGKVVVLTGLRCDAEKIAQVLSQPKTWGTAKKNNAVPQVWMAHGGTPPGDRDFIRHDYMNHPGPCVLVGTTDCWGESQNLQDTDNALVGMLPFTPGQVRQLEGRFSRRGQKRPVLVRYFIAEGTADEHVAHLLLDKLPAVEAVAKDEVLAEFANDLRGDENEVVDGLLAKLLAPDDEDEEVEGDADRRGAEENSEEGR